MSFSHDEDTFRILIATDIHLGYGEKDKIRGKDTFETFEEILQTAATKDVDFILLGGDLFHETRPSPYCITRCTELIKKYCFGDRNVQIEFLSNPEVNFKNSHQRIVNYEDPNLNISIPVFSIHGNHDDPTGAEQISALDLMSSMGLINYFGRWTDLAKVEVQPIILGKGSSTLALYGLSHIKDERLARLYLDKKVTVMAPANSEDYFHLFVLHQNRADRGVKNYISDSAIPDFMDFVIWGHEHDCKIEPELALNGKTYISQPGSSVATSLAAGESLPKRIAILQIKGTNYKMDYIPLKTVRPFVFAILELPEPHLATFNPNDRRVAEEATAQITKKIDEMLVEAKTLDRQPNLLPLIRLIVRYSHEEQTFNAIRFGHRYQNSTANPDDIVKFQPVKVRSRTNRVFKQADADIEDDNGEEQIGVSLEKLIEQNLTGKNELELLSVKALNAAVMKFIYSEDNDAPQYIIQCQEKEAIDVLNSLKPDLNEMNNFSALVVDRRDTNLDNTLKLLNDPARVRTTQPQAPPGDGLITINDSDDDDDNTSVAMTSSHKVSAETSTRGRGRGSRGRRPRGRKI